MLSIVLRSLPKLDALLVNTETLALVLDTQMKDMAPPTAILDQMSRCNHHLNHLLPYRPTFELAAQTKPAHMRLLFHSTQIQQVNRRGSVRNVEKEMLDSSLLTTHYAGNVLCSSAIKKLLSNKLVMPTKEKIGQLLVLVSHCEGFFFSCQTWLRLIRRQEFQPVYRAIVHKILNGQTIHHYRKGHHQKLFNSVAMRSLVFDLDNLDVFFRLSADGIRFNHLDDFPEDCSLLAYHALVQKEIFPHLSFELLDCSFVHASVESPLVDEVKQAVQQYTDTQIHTERWVRTLAGQLESFDFVRETLLNLRQQTDKVVPLVWSLKHYGPYWNQIIGEFFDRQEPELIEWLLVLEPRLRDYIQELASFFRLEVNNQDSFLFQHWLLSHNFDLVDPPTKRKRLAPLEEPSPKKQKLDNTQIQDCS